MKRLSEEFDLLLNGIDPMEGEMARELLSEHGIPSLVQGPDFDVVEFGSAAHGVTRHPDLYVPKGSRIAARAILAEAWGEERLLRLDPESA
jgi:hypothetical protein